MSDHPDETYNEDVLECPHCHHIDRDAWEMGATSNQSEGETECGKCGKEFKWSRVTSISYIGTPIEKP